MRYDVAYITSDRAFWMPRDFDDSHSIADLLHLLRQELADQEDFIEVPQDDSKSAFVRVSSIDAVTISRRSPN